MTKCMSRLLKVLAISLATVAISRGGAVSASTLPVASLQASVEKGLRTPTRLAVGADGALYVADPANQGVLIYSPAGTLRQKIKVAGIPQGVAVTAAGRILVSQREFVAMYDLNGAELKRLGSGNGQFVAASDIALDETGRIYVTDSKGRSVQVFDANGVYLSRFGVAGSGAGQFLYPTAIAYEKQSQQIAVVDSLNARIQFYDKAGTFIRSIGGNGTGPLKFMHPQGIAFEYCADSSVRMYVADGMLKNIQAIDPTGTGTFLSYVKAGKGIEHGSPSDLAFDQSSRRLYIVDGLGSVTVYKIADGSVVVNSVTTTPANATVIASSALSGTAAAVAVVTATTVAPFTLSMVGDGASVSSELLDVTGLASNVSSVKVNGQPVPLVNGFFTTAVALQNGVNDITVTATDLSGKSWSELRSVTRNESLPLFTITTPDVQVTDNATLLLAGSVGKELYVSVSGVPADISSQKWSAQVTLSPGINTVEVQAIDLNGQAVSRKRTLFYTPTAPSLAITAPAEDLIVVATDKTVISGTISASSDTTVTAEVNGKPVKVVVSGGLFSLPVDFVTEGVYTVTVSASVAGGTTSTIGRSLLYRMK